MPGFRYKVTKADLREVILLCNDEWRTAAQIYAASVEAGRDFLRNTARFRYALGQAASQGLVEQKYSGEKLTAHYRRRPGVTIVNSTEAR